MLKHGAILLVCLAACGGASQPRPAAPPTAPPRPAADAPHETAQAREEAQARARSAYQTNYGQVCESALGAHEPAPPDQPVRELDNAAKRPALTARIDDVQRCYTKARNGWPDLRGELEVQVMIAGAGTVESSRVVSSGFPVPEVACCLRQVLQSLRFPASADGSRTSATYEFAFKP